MDVREKLVELLKTSACPSTLTCADCIHEFACRGWTGGRYISDISSSQCPNHETVKESSAYLCGVLDERKRKKTNADRIRTMTDEELSELLTHINPTNCQDCAFSHGWSCQPDRDDYSDFEKCKEGRKRWLQQPTEEAYNETVGERKDGDN